MDKLENRIFHKTYTGTPQGRIISPLLANIALHGMEDVLKVKYHKNGSKNGRVRYTNASKYVVTKYLMILSYCVKQRKMQKRCMNYYSILLKVKSFFKFILYKNICCQTLSDKLYFI